MRFIGKWEEEMGIQLEEQQVGKMIGVVYDYATDINAIEMNYKVIWYITPEKIQKYQHDKSPLCWRGCRQTGTMTHI